MPAAHGRRANQCVYDHAQQNARDAGMPLGQIGEELGVSRQRIRQLLDKLYRRE